MACPLNTTPVPAQQPGLRSFIVFDRLPEGCEPFIVTDETNMPHLRPGDVAVIETTERQPQRGELFLIQWSNGNRAIVETWTRALRAGSGAGRELIDTVCWFVSGSNRAKSPAEVSARLARNQYVGWVDGPYATEGANAGALDRKLVGKVVGILQPTFDEPRRLEVA